MLLLIVFIVSVVTSNFTLCLNQSRSEDENVCFTIIQQRKEKGAKDSTLLSKSFPQVDFYNVYGSYFETSDFRSNCSMNTIDKLNNETLNLKYLPNYFEYLLKNLKSGIFLKICLTYKKSRFSLKTTCRHQWKLLNWSSAEAKQIKKNNPNKIDEHWIQ